MQKSQGVRGVCAKEPTGAATRHATPLAYTIAYSPCAPRPTGPVPRGKLWPTGSVGAGHKLHRVANASLCRRPRAPSCAHTDPALLARERGRRAAGRPRVPEGLAAGWRVELAQLQRRVFLERPIHVPALPCTACAPLSSAPLSRPLHCLPASQPACLLTTACPPSQPAYCAPSATKDAHWL